MGWKREDFNRRRYVIESDAFEKAKRIEVKVFVDGKQFAHMQVREPGLIAVVSAANDPGIELDIVEGSGKRYTDYFTPSGERTEPVAAWQFELLGIEK